MLHVVPCKAHIFLFLCIGDEMKLMVGMLYRFDNIEVLTAAVDSVLRWHFFWTLWKKLVVTFVISYCGLLQILSIKSKKDILGYPLVHHSNRARLQYLSWMTLGMCCHVIFTVYGSYNSYNTNIFCIQIIHQFNIIKEMIKKRLWSFSFKPWNNLLTTLYSKLFFITGTSTKKVSKLNILNNSKSNSKQFLKIWNWLWDKLLTILNYLFLFKEYLINCFK